MKPNRRALKNAGRTQYALLDIDSVYVDAAHKGTNMHWAGIEQLAASVKRHGLLQPILVRKSAQPGTYRLICGTRRLEACRIIGMTQVHAMVIEADEPEAVACWLEAHLTRRQHLFLYEAERIRRAGADAVGERFALPKALLTERLEMLALPERVKDAVNAYDLTLEQAWPLLEIGDEDMQLEAAQLIAQRGLGARQARRLVHGPEKAGDASKQRRGMGAAIAAIHETIRKLDGRGVEAQVGMHSHEDGMCIQIYLKNLRFSNRSTGES